MQQSAETSNDTYRPVEPIISRKKRLFQYWHGRSGCVARLLLLAATVCAVWLTIENRWGSNFQLPTRYDYDAHLVLGMMRLAQQGDLGLFSHIYTNSLGAPFTGQLNDWP